MMNLLEMALPVLTNIVSPCVFEYRTVEGSDVDEYGVVRTVYSDWKTCTGMVQPINAKTKEILGLEPATRGITVWGSIDFNTLDVQDQCDQVRWRGGVYNCDSCTDWHHANGWKTFVCTLDKRGQTE